MEWDGNQWVDTNSTDFAPTIKPSRRDNTSSEKLDWNTDEKSYYDDIGMEDPDELNQFNRRQKK
jgi:hypothetical protein